MNPEPTADSTSIHTHGFHADPHVIFPALFRADSQAVSQPDCQAALPVVCESVFAASEATA